MSNVTAIKNALPLKEEHVKYERSIQFIWEDVSQLREGYFWK
jgi:hypothetical protein